MSAMSPVEEIFFAVLGKTTPQERAACLALSCGDDSTLRGRVERLLVAHARVGDFLEQPALGLTSAAPASPLEATESTAPALANTETFGGTAGQVGAVIAGRYRLLEPIGEGGMGTVWVAEQVQPVRRKVALKLIKAGMDSKAVLTRFEAERQALALMDHPNIARVLDGGTTESGRPFFVMEYVKGVHITRYCDGARLSVADRLALFVSVCRAVQHAHQKGIIHRDLKPSNILVCLYDGRPVPKVIDFGLAKAVHQPLTEHTLHTAQGVLMGTPLYMSPEQAEVNNFDVDTRADVYALGVILYELLTGTTPLEKQRFREAAWHELLRLIKEEEPPRPSTRLSASGSLPGRAAQRQLEAAKLVRLVRGELDWIVMKALEKDRSRRYETADGLARDIERYLADEAVEACPPSASYRLRKFARKNRAVLTTAAAVGLLLMAAVSVSTWQAARATAAEAVAEAEATQRAAAEYERDRAVKAEDLAQQRLQQAAAEGQRADVERTVAVAVNEFLRNDLLAEAAPGKNPRGKQVTVEEILARAAARIEQKFAAQPLVEAAIRLTIGETYHALGDYRAARPHLERALEIRRQLLGEDHPDTLAAMNALALLYKALGDYTKALPLLERACELRQRLQGDSQAAYAESLNNLALLYQAMGDYVKALPLLEQARDLRQRSLGESHPAYAESLNNLALLYKAVGRIADAEPLFVKALEIRRRALGEAHLETLTSMSNLALLYEAQGQRAKAEPLLVNALEGYRSIVGNEHPYTLSSVNNLAVLYQAQGQTARAEPLLVKALGMYRARYPKDRYPSGHPDLAQSLDNLATLHKSAADYAKAEPLYQEALAMRRALYPKDRYPSGHPYLAQSLDNLALLYQAQGQFAKAEPLFGEAVAGARQVLGVAHPNTRLYIGNLIACHEQMGQPAKAEPLYRELADFQKKSGPASLQYAESLAPLGLNLLRQNKWTDAESVLRECLAVREEKEPDAWMTFNTRSMLGGGLLGQTKYAEAEPLLLAGYQGMKQREEKIPPASRVCLVEAAGRLVQLYDAWDKKDKAEQWREKLAQEKAAMKSPGQP
jgi:tetratricopeptide (TPR) repeat protein